MTLVRPVEPVISIALVPGGVSHRGGIVMAASPWSGVHRPQLLGTSVGIIDEPGVDLARQLHEYSVGLIQGLFRTSVQIRSAETASDIGPAEVSRILRELDESITALRLRMFALEASSVGERMTLWASVRDVCHRAETCLGLPVHLSRQGKVDEVASRSVISDVTGVVREALALAAHVARSLEVSIEADQVLLIDLRLVGVAHLDDHRGFLTQMVAAARQSGSVCETETHGSDSVFLMHWAIPLPERI